ncbi:MAG TPA: PAS domain S-box protein [Thermoanaerobaculia bacterium]|nr:PAS domain S-box protein [Thermoanaerobaculia bacterium]
MAKLEADPGDLVTERDWSELFSATLDAAVDGVLVIDEGGCILRVNRAAERMFGWDVGELLGLPVETLMPEPYVHEHAGYVQRYLAGGEARIIGIGREVQGRRRDGSVFPMDLAVGEGRTERGRIFVGLIRDLSERKSMETELQRRQEALQRMLDNALIATAIVDADGCFLQLNGAWERVLGRSAGDLLGTRLAEVTEPDGRATLAAAFADLCDSVKDVTLDDYACVRAGGEVRRGALYLAAVREPLPRRPEVVAQMVDRSQEIQAERELRSARERLAHMNRLGTLGEMAAGIAHEVNQPLGAIANYAEAGRLLHAAGGSEERLGEVLEKISAQARRAGEVIRRLRSLARGEGGGRQVVEVNQVVLSAVRLAEIEPRSTDPRVELELDPELPEALADPVQIQQVLLNLLRNGLEAERELRPQGTLPPLRVRTSRQRGEIVVSVRDRGAGVSPDVAREIMSPFVTTKGAGMGMGLAICQSIVAAHGGRLWFEPNDDGPGTEFSFSLPIEGA